jgi:transposase
MLNIQKNKSCRKQYSYLTLDDLVPEDNFYRGVDQYINFDFIYDLVYPKYSLNTGRPSIDPVFLIKMAMIQYFDHIKSMRQTFEECKVNNAYRWFLGLGFNDPLPHFSTYSKNYCRRFKDDGQPSALFRMIFKHILDLCQKADLVDTTLIFVDGTPVKAHANNHKFKKVMVEQTPKFYQDELEKEINAQRQAEGKKPIEMAKPEMKETKISTTDPDAGWFHKAEHKQNFSYNVQCACDCHGWILDYAVKSGNLHDSTVFKEIYDEIRDPFQPHMMVMDSGYKFPFIAHLLEKDGILPVFPYSRPKGAKSGLRKKSFTYDEAYNGYFCPQGQWIKYSTTNKKGYQEYKSNPKICKTCPLLEKCTKSKIHIKVIDRSLWADSLDLCERLRLAPGIKETYRGIYNKRKETIERIFGDAKEFHDLRYTTQNGLAAMKDKVALTFACLNIKKYVKMMRARA